MGVPYKFEIPQKRHWLKRQYRDTETTNELVTQITALGLSMEFFSSPTWQKGRFEVVIPFRAEKTLLPI